MKRRVREFRNLWNEDDSNRAFASTAVSALIGLAFTVYNGFLGIFYRSIWNGSICVYYVLLAAVRGILVYAHKSERITDGERKNVHLATHLILFLLNAALIVPLAAMIKGDRTYQWGLIPAIAIAAYTFYRITMAALHYVKSRKTNNALVKQLRTSNLINALVAILTLQNTLILANEGVIAGGMKILSAISSAVIWLVIVGLSIASFRHS